MQARVVIKITYTVPKNGRKMRLGPRHKASPRLAARGQTHIHRIIPPLGCKAEMSVKTLCHSGQGCPERADSRSWLQILKKNLTVLQEAA